MIAILRPDGSLNYATAVSPKRKRGERPLWREEGLGESPTRADVKGERARLTHMLKMKESPSGFTAK